jgi:exonuclease SbcD
MARRKSSAAARTRPRLVHLSDTHLGLQDFDAADPATGLNVREADLYRAFDACIDGAIALKPDVVVHAGDLFDAVRPGNRSLCVALEGFRRLSAAGIPAVVIAGNHETPRTPAVGNVLRALAVLPGVHAVCDGEVRVVEAGGLAIHAVADAPTVDGLAAALAKVEALPGRRNVLLAHAGVAFGAERAWAGEFNEHHVPHDLLVRLSGFDYIALGHWHRHAPVRGTSNAFYSGSTERMSLDEAGNVPGFLEVALDPLDVRHHAVPARPMVDLGEIDCAGLDPERVLARVRESVAGRVAGAIARVVLARLSPQTYAALDPADVRAFAAGALHFECVRDVLQEGASRLPAAGSLAALPEEFARFLEACPLEAGFDRAALRELGLALIAKAMEGGGA